MNIHTSRINSEKEEGREPIPRSPKKAFNYGMAKFWTVWKQVIAGLMWF
jgi:hypothetical protein